MPESEPHRRIKEIIQKKLQEWFGASVEEYLSSGHELDVFAVTSSGISIYVEIVWHDSMSQFLKDMNMLQQSDADVKVVIGSPEVIGNGIMTREFSKIVVSQRRAGKTFHGDILSGNQILEDREYAENGLKKLLSTLVTEAETRPKPEAALQIVSLVPAKSNWASGNFFNIIGKVFCKGQRIAKRLDASLQFINMQNPVKYVSVSDDGKVDELDWKELDFSWSPDGSDNDNIRGELPEMRQGDSIFAVFPDAVGNGYGGNGHLWWWKHFFEFAPASKYEVKLVVRGISGSLTVSAEKTIDFST
jgi:hypothetical protein